MRWHCPPNIMQNSTPGCLRPSTLPLGHEGSQQYLIFTSERGRNIIVVSLKLECQSRVRSRDPRLSKQAALTTFTIWGRARYSTILNLYKWAGEQHLVSLKLECQSGARTRDLRLSKQAAVTTAPRPPPTHTMYMYTHCIGYITELNV